MHSQLSLLCCQLHVLWGQMVHYTIHITFSVPCVTDASNDGQIYSSLMPLEVNSISLATGYEFKHENQSIYLSKDLCEFTPGRQWPNITLPVPASIPPQPAPVGPNTQLIRAMQATHDMAADILWSQGTDPCAVYREKQVEYILNHVESGHKKCRVCNKELSSTQKLKSHIRATHCHSTAYKCSTCSKPFGDPYTLSVHKRVHTALARKHICAYCGNACLSKSDLTDHEKKHTIGHLTCLHCHKSFAEKKGLVDHLKICKKVPGYDQRSEEELWPYKCPDCF